MREAYLSPSADFTANSLSFLGGPPVDFTADNSLLFSGLGSALSVTGNNVMNPSTLLAGTGIAGTAYEANLSNVAPSAYDFGISLGGSGFSLIAVMKFANSGATTFSSRLFPGFGGHYGFDDLGAINAVVATSATTDTSHPTLFSYGAWQMYGYDADTAGNVSIYRGYGGQVNLDATYNPAGAYYTPAETLQIGGNGSGINFNIALCNIYKGANRLTNLAAFAQRYSAIAKWFNGNGSGTPLLGNSI